MVYAGSVLKSSSWSGAMELVAQFIKGKLKLDNFKKEDVKHIRTHRLSEEFCRHLVNNWKLNLQDPKLTMLQTELKVDHRKMELCVVESVTLASIVDTEQTLSVTTGLGPSIPGAPSADVDLQHSTKDSHTGSGIQIGFNMFGLAVDTIDVGGRTASIKLKYIPPKGEVWGADVPPDELISTPSYGAQKYISSLLQGAPDNAAVSDLEINDEVEDGTSDSVACTPGSSKHCADGDASPGQQHHKRPRPSE